MLDLLDEETDVCFQIVRMVESNQVVVIEGSTGCGKSTQVPQYILDQHASRNLPCNIVVTQPRRIAATSIAKWVCKDRGWELGKIVGYQVPNLFHCFHVPHKHCRVAQVPPPKKMLRILLCVHK